MTGISKISFDISATTTLLESAMTGLYLSVENPGSEQSNDIVHLSMTAIDKVINDLHEIWKECVRLEKEHGAEDGGC